VSRGFLLDANIISELVKAKPSPSLTKWINSTDESLLDLSVLTLGEIRKGITSLPDATRRVALEAWLNHDLALRFSGRVLSIDHPCRPLGKNCRECCRSEVAFACHRRAARRHSAAPRAYPCNARHHARYYQRRFRLQPLDYVRGQQKEAANLHHKVFRPGMVHHDR
jgi:hypothetical protein